MGMPQGTGLSGPLGQGGPASFCLRDSESSRRSEEGFFSERHLPVALTRTLAVVWASSLSTVLMPLTLGFRVVSYPSLADPWRARGSRPTFRKGKSEPFRRTVPARTGGSLSSCRIGRTWMEHTPYLILGTGPAGISGSRGNPEIRP